ncbi:MAG: substrate-binding domain-containing protein [Planctomycetes bacterium]|nr:substrate-binding domain-containing protein [Planctomycetota bacterium]
MQRDSTALLIKSCNGPAVRLLQAVGMLFALSLFGCSDPETTESITLVTTTSTRDSGLLDELLPEFKKQTGITVKPVAVGSGQALELARRGDADVLFTHSPAAEEKFVADGFGVGRRSVMYNDFVLVGPKADPAKLLGMTAIAEAFSRLAAAQTPFVSRGDESGTHTKERAIWLVAKIAPKGEWYIRAGTGMAHTLRIASEKFAYTLTDRGTFLAQKHQLELAIICQRDPLLRNDYSVTLVNPKKHSHVHHAAAQKFAEFLTTPSTQQLIERFGVEKFGEPLFFPSAK